MVDTGIDEWPILKRIVKKIRWEAVDCIYLTEDRAKWRAFVNTVMCF